MPPLAVEVEADSKIALVRQIQFDAARGWQFDRSDEVAGRVVAKASVAYRDFLRTADDQRHHRLIDARDRLRRSTVFIERDARQGAGLVAIGSMPIDDGA